MYGADTWTVKKAQEKKLDVAEMRMLRWMSGVTEMDRIRNGEREFAKCGEISRCFEHAIQSITSGILVYRLSSKSKAYRMHGFEEKWIPKTVCKNM